MHPLIKILSFLLILLLINYLSGLWLGVVFCLVLIAAGTIHFKSFFKLIKRMRWLLLSILLIYAFTTPGEYVPNIPAVITPTIEGLEHGVLQVMRLMVALAALTLLYAGTSATQLILGLYLLLMPLKYLGVNVERFVVRLSLTLQYVEDFAMRDDRKKLNFEQFKTMMLVEERLPDSDVVDFEHMPFKRMDKLLAGVFVSAIFSLFIICCLGLRLQS